MGKETPVYIEDLRTDWPLAGDSRAEGDDHLRNIKVAIKGSFTSLGAAPVTATAAQLNYTTVAVVTMVASKCLVADAGKAFDFDNGAMANVDINSGAIDGAVIGANDAAAITGTTITGTTITGTTVNASTTLQIGGVAVTKSAAQINAVGLSLTAGTAAAERGLGTAGLTTQAHGFAALPSMVVCVLECTTNDQGYVVGDQISFGGNIISLDAASKAGATVYSDTTNIYIAIDNDAIDRQLVVDPAGTTTITLDSSDWKVVATAYKFA